MDDDLCRWILEFLLRQPIPDCVLSKALSVLPLSNRDTRFKKTLLLRSIQSETKGSCSVSESVLEKLELVEELDCIDGIAVSDSMKAAYCAVAVWCTVKHVGGGVKAEYFGAVKRIWKGKVGKLEGKSELYSNELRKWRDEIEAVVVDGNSWRNLLEKKRSAEENALRSLKSYLEEAWAIMGPSFLESAAKTVMVMQGSGTGNEQLNNSIGVWPATELDLSRDLGVNGIGRDELAAKMVNPGEVQGQGDPKVPNKVEERAASGLDSTRDLGGNDGDKIESAAQTMNRGEVKGLGDPQVSAGLHNPNQDLGGSTLELATKAMNREQVQGLVDKHVGENAGEMVGKPPRKKHAARRRRVGKGVKLNDSVDSDSDASGNRYDCLPSPEVRRVQEALKSSTLELRAVVKDPLPSALRVSENVRCEIQRKNMNGGPSVENQIREDLVGAPIPDIERTVEPVQANEANLINQNKAAKPSLMERNSTAQTYEWEDSDCDSPEETTMEKIHLPTPKRINCSPLKIVDTKVPKRRKVRRWSIVEEDALRTAVHLHGKGNWKFILNNYRDIFEDRTEVDLKDKWRNLTR